ncbi:hypothetical protein [Shewanella surugensis]|uniref:Uncharacterized protein n=1 Tax=Shewanella surugensis TaxID=212020 RepID=A0ABT0L765_9GAMM|nr:hypothetical protein [Shewanella surugensis]MCL1123542.1 hypothetical protein [Shewanella surugensis]
MYAQVEKPKENKSRTVANSVAQKKCNGGISLPCSARCGYKSTQMTPAKTQNNYNNGIRTLLMGNGLIENNTEINREVKQLVKYDIQNEMMNTLGLPVNMQPYAGKLKIDEKHITDSHLYGGVLNDNTKTFFTVTGTALNQENQIMALVLDVIKNGEGNWNDSKTALTFYKENFTNTVGKDHNGKNLNRVFVSVDVSGMTTYDDWTKGKITTAYPY